MFSQIWYAHYTSIPYFLSACDTENKIGLGRWKGHSGRDTKSVEKWKKKMRNQEKLPQWSLKCLIILRAASPYEYTLYLLTISSSLFCGPWLIAPFNLHVCEMRGLQCVLAWLCECALLARCWASGWEINKWKVEISSMYTVFCF